MKLLIIIPSTIRGGVEEYALRIAKASVKNGWQVGVAFPKRKETDSLVRDLRDWDISYKKLELSEKSYRKNVRLRKDLPNFVKTIFLLIRYRPQVVLIIPGHTLQCFGSILACGLLRVPTLVRFGLVSSICSMSRNQMNAYKWARNRKQQWMTVSKNNMELVSRSFEVPTESLLSIQNGTKIDPININAFREENQNIRNEFRNELGIELDSPLMLTVGRLDKQKGHEDLADIIPNISKEFPKIKFIWVGEGQLESELKKKLKRSSVLDKVIFLGYRSDVLRILRACDLFIFPTYFEGSPSVIVESMAHLLPIVSSDASGIPEVIENKKHGLLFKTGDKAELLDSVFWALRNEYRMKEMALEARKHVAANFSLEDMINKTFSTIEDLAKK